MRRLLALAAALALVLVPAAGGWSPSQVSFTTDCDSGSFVIITHVENPDNEIYAVGKDEGGWAGTETGPHTFQVTVYTSPDAAGVTYPYTINLDGSCALPGQKPDPNLPPPLVGVIEAPVAAPVVAQQPAPAPDVGLTNAQLRDDVLRHIKAAKVSYQTWLRNKEDHVYPDVTQTHWWWVIDSLAKIK
jgi:hypothetical protein